MFTETRILPDREEVKCSSLLKPLYVWAARRTDIHAAASIINSSNASTEVVVNNVGLPRLLRRLEDACGVRWVAAETWGSVMVTREQVHQAYDALLDAAATGDGDALWVVNSMRGVPQWQRFGADTGLPVKAEWDVDEEGARTHRVVLRGSNSDGWFPEVILTRSVVDDQWRGQWEMLLQEKAMRGLAAMHIPLLMDVLKR